MDIMSILGWIIGGVLIVISIMLTDDPETGKKILQASNLSGFWDIPSVAIVFGGTLAALMISYPLKSIDSAWETLKKGDGYIASAEQDLQAVVVRRIYLAYFDAEEAQQFLQPIYVFAGDNSFLAYVPAISDNVTKSESNTYED